MFFSKLIYSYFLIAYKFIINVFHLHYYLHTGSAITSKNFDITLMICLLRNISGIAPPFTGYDTLPSPTDISKGADLARIKHYRNEIAHSTDSKMLTQEFEDAWNDVSTVRNIIQSFFFSF